MIDGVAFENLQVQANKKNANFEAGRGSLLTNAQAFLDVRLGEINELNNNHLSGRKVVRQLTLLFDQLCENLYTAAVVGINQHEVDNCALIALGGYGRAEMNPRSDLDLMFYYLPAGKDAARVISDRMLYLLWDLHLDVGYSIRSSAECLEESSDCTVRSALLDARLIVGGHGIFATFNQNVGHYMLNRDTATFIKHKLIERAERKKKYGSSIYLLEPNLKEGEGGLRELQEALWIARVKFKSKNLDDLLKKGVITEQDYYEYNDALDYLWKVRNFIHFYGQRKGDQLTFELQRQIAVALGYKNVRQTSAVEQFMRSYYSRAFQVEHLATKLILVATQSSTLQHRKPFNFISRRNLEDGFYIVYGELRTKKDQRLLDDPVLMMVAFELAQKHEVQMCIELKQLIRDNSFLINDKIRRSKRINSSFLTILRYSKGATKILRKMHHLQFLNAYIPEFKKIYCRVQFDQYHIYTVDIHTLFAIEEMEKVWHGDYAQDHPLITGVANNIEKRGLLMLAILFHDIGKGSGKDHSVQGAEMIPVIARRMRLNKEDSKRLQFLVLNHLQMTFISQRRDLQDMYMISQFAEKMEMSETLRMLYLLTFADLKAVGPDVWSEWKGGLLRELYEKTFDVLEKNEFFHEQRSEKVRNRKRKIRIALGGEFPESRIATAIKSLNTRYLLSYRVDEIIPHLRLALGRGKKTLVMHVEHNYDAKYSELTIATIDTPGLFSQIAGVLTGNSINILGAQIHTRKTGAVLDILQVNSMVGDIVENKQKWERVERDLGAVLEGRSHIEDLFDQNTESDYFSEVKGQHRREDQVIIDNDVSNSYTVIDIFTYDKSGLLYEITKTMNQLGLYITVSKVSTKVDQVADVFYVSDIFGQKIIDPVKLEEIRTSILDSLK